MARLIFLEYLDLFELVEAIQFPEDILNVVGRGDALERQSIETTANTVVRHTSRR